MKERRALVTHTLESIFRARFSVRAFESPSKRSVGIFFGGFGTPVWLSRQLAI